MNRWLCVALVVPALGCRGESRSAGFQVDSLASGTVLVRDGAVGRWASTGEDPWTLQEDLRIGRVEGEGPDVFGRIRNVIPGSDGTIWVLDSQAHELRQFGPDGAFLRTLGRAGQGPGEFGSNPCAFPGPDGEIWVESGGRWQRFDASGQLLGGQQVTRSLGCGILAWRGEEMAAAFVRFDPATREMSTGFILYDRLADGSVSIRDTVPAPDIPKAPTVEWSEGGRVRMSRWVPLAPVPGYFLQPSGDFWVTDGGGPYRFRRQTLEGDTLLMVERQYEPVPVPDSIRDAEIDSLKWDDHGYPDDFDPSDVPRVFPPFERIVEADDGTVWLRRRIQGGRASYDVFRATGEFLGPVALPPGLETFSVRSITDDHMYGVARDSLDVQYVVRLRIQR